MRFVFHIDYMIVFSWEISSVSTLNLCGFPPYKLVRIPKKLRQRTAKLYIIPGAWSCIHIVQEPATLSVPMYAIAFIIII